MNDHGYEESSTTIHKKISKLDRKNLKKIINDLIRRRQEHEERINKLLDPNYHHQDITKASPRQGDNEFSEMLRKLEVEEPQALQESLGNLGNHVNLLATVSLKTEYFLSQKHHIKQEGELYKSLLSRFGKKPIVYDFDENEPEGAAEWIKSLVKYLIAEDLTNGLFVLTQLERGKYDFYATHFEKGKYQELQLSKEALQEEEMDLIFRVNRQESESINISWLLLARLLKGTENLNFPLAIHKMFSFPYKQFFIKESQQLIRMNELLGVLPLSQNAKMNSEKTVKMYGIEQNGETCEIFNLSKSKNFKNYQDIVHHFRSLLIMNQVEFPVKHIPLSCLKHHFVVVTLIVQAEDYYYINIGNGTNQRFRVCLLDFQGNIVQYETINNGEFMLSLLKEEEYELYISPQGTVEEVVAQDESYELVKQTQEQFSIWIQGSSVCTKQGDLQLQIRLKEQYNSYTLKIAKKYISEQDFYKQPEDNCGKDSIIIKRYILKVMDLVVDEFINSKLQKLKMKLVVKYKANSLCDQHFQEHTVHIGINDSIVLREETEIQSIITSDQSGTKLKTKVIRFFL